MIRMARTARLREARELEDPIERIQEQQNSDENQPDANRANLEALASRRHNSTVAKITVKRT
jgi:hypothetical protein